MKYLVKVYYLLKGFALKAILYAGWLLSWMSAQAGKGKGHQSQREFVQIQSGNCQNITYFNESIHIHENLCIQFGWYLSLSAGKDLKYINPIFCQIRKSQIQNKLKHNAQDSFSKDIGAFQSKILQFSPSKILFLNSLSGT